MPCMVLRISTVREFASVGALLLFLNCRDGSAACGRLMGSRLDVFEGAGV